MRGSDRSSQEDDGSADGEVRQGVLYLLPVVGGNLLPLLTLPILLHLLSPEDYGFLALATAYGAVSTGLAQLGLLQGFEREFFAEKGERFQAGLLFTILVTVTVCFVPVLAVSWLTRLWWAETLIRDSRMTDLLMVTLGAQMLQAIRQYQLTYFRNRGQAGRYARYSLAEAVLWAGLSLLFVAVLDTGVIGIPLGQLIGTTAVSAAMAFRAFGAVGFLWEGAALRSALMVGVPLTPRVLIGVLGSHLDKVLLGVLSTVGGVGLYSVGQRLAYGVFSYMTALENVSTPRVLAMMFEGGAGVAERIGRYLTPFAYWSVLVAVLVALFARQGLAIVAPPEYAGAAPLVSLLSFHYAVMFYGKQKQLLFAKKTHMLPLLSLVLLGLNVGLNVPLIQRFGALGAALGTTLAGTGYVWLTFRVSQRYYPIRYEQVPMAAIFGLLGIAVLTSVGLEFLSVGALVDLTTRILLLGAFLLLGWRLDLVTPAGVRTLRKAIFQRTGERARPQPMEADRR